MFCFQIIPNGVRWPVYTCPVCPTGWSPLHLLCYPASAVKNQKRAGTFNSCAVLFVEKVLKPAVLAKVTWKQYNIYFGDGGLVFFCVCVWKQIFSNTELLYFRSDYEEVDVFYQEQPNQKHIQCWFSYFLKQIKKKKSKPLNTAMQISVYLAIHC
jgi:hypothetical protein